MSLVYFDRSSIWDSKDPQEAIDKLFRKMDTVPRRRLFKRAQQMADLLNSHNNLLSQRTCSGILEGPLYLVLPLKDCLAGGCALHRRGPHFTEIRHLVVNPDFRGRKLAKLLVGSCLKLVSTPLVYAVTSATNVPSNQVFYTLGFEKLFSFSGHAGELHLLIRRMSRKVHYIPQA